VQGKWVPAGEYWLMDSWAARLRKQVYERSSPFRKKPHGFKLVACEHIRLQPWVSFGKKKSK
jgi:hypothetical protein